MEVGCLCVEKYVFKSQDYILIENFSSEDGNVMPKHVTVISLQ